MNNTFLVRYDDTHLSSTKRITFWVGIFLLLIIGWAVGAVVETVYFHIDQIFVLIPFLLGAYLLALCVSLIRRFFKELAKMNISKDRLEFVFFRQDNKSMTREKTNIVDVLLALPMNHHQGVYTVVPTLYIKSKDMAEMFYLRNKKDIMPLAEILQTYGYSGKYPTAEDIVKAYKTAFRRSIVSWIIFGFGLLSLSFVSLLLLLKDM